MASPGVIQAAGGVVWRRGPAGPEVAVVHRPRYDDWSLPKGKLEPGELHLPAAMREVREETGVVGAARASLGTTAYDAGGRPKQVRWWSIRADSGEFAANDEVGELRWVPPAEALGLVREQEPLRRWLELPVEAGVVLLVRHASAGDAGAWPGPDDERPLDDRGRRQAAQIAAVLPAYRPVRVITAPPRRCIDTVAGLALAVGRDLEVDEGFGEVWAPSDPERLLLDLVVPGEAIVICSQGGVIPRILHALLTEPRDVHVRKGSVWVLTVHDGRLVQAEDDVLT
jgi:8-oxo-dGTP diphosphatase